MADERGVFTRIGDRLQGVASWFGRGAESLNTFGKDAGDVIHTQAQRLKFGAAPVSDPAAAAKAAEAIAKTGTTAAPAANAAITATQAAANTLAPVANTAKTVTEVVANVGTTTASGAKLASAATEAATNAGTVAASAAESSGKIASVTKLLRLGRAGGFLTGFFVAGAAGGTAKAMGATTEEATNIAADTAPLVREGKAIAEGRYVEAGHRLIDEVPLLGVAANTLLRPVTRFFGADVDPSIAEAVGEIYTSLTQVKGGQEQNVSPSRPSVPASMPHNTANAAQAFTTGGGW
jgi:hypothetical protein